MSKSSIKTIVCCQKCRVEIKLSGDWKLKNGRPICRKCLHNLKEDDIILK